jgi:acyl-CoA thioesterase-1
LGLTLNIASACGSNRTRDSQAPEALPSAEITGEALPTGPKVVFLGDSVAAGIHLSADEAFPAVLQRKLAARGKPFQLINAGVSGDTSAGGLRRVDWLLKQSPNIVVVELGANDGMRGIAPAVMEHNLRGIVEKIQASGAQTLLLGMRIPPSFGADHAAELAAVYERIADDLEVPFVPYFMKGVAGVPELNLQDGIHPTAEGHERLASTLQEPLQELLEASR